MVDVAEKTLIRGQLGFTQLRYVVYEVHSINTNDTITLGELQNVINNSSFCLDTGASITTSVTGNIVTITEVGLTKISIVGLAVVSGGSGEEEKDLFFPYEFPYRLS